MTTGSLRLALGVGALAVLWVLVYWWTPTEPKPSIAFQSPPVESPEPVVEAPPPPADEPKSEPERPAVVPPTFYEHTVERGDTAQSIAKKYYGTSEHWQAVMRANPKTDFQHLRAGLVVRVPVDPKNVQGVGAPDTPREESPHGIEYVVEKGDTLTGLAFRFYGRASVYQWIIDANKEALGPDGSKLKAGMKIVIPPAPDGAGR